MHALVVFRALFPLLLVCACQAPRPNVLEEMPAPRLMQVQTASEPAHLQAIGPSSWVQIDWFAGRKKLGTLERRVSGEARVDDDGRVPEAKLLIDFESSQAPARLPRGLQDAAQTLSLSWSESAHAAADSSVHRANLNWNRRQGEVLLELRRHRSRGKVAGPGVLENLRPAPIALLDYGLALELSVDGNPSSLTEARLTLHLHTEAAEPR